MNKSNPHAIVFGTALFGLLALIACNEEARAKVNIIFKDSPKMGIVAKINGTDITENELVGDAELDLLQIKKQEYDLKMNQLNRLVTERVLGAEAKKEGLANADEYIQKKVLKGEIKISDTEYKLFVKEKNIPESNINDQVKERIQTYLKEQKRAELVQGAVAKLTQHDPVEVYFKKPKSNIQVEVGSAPATGGEHAKVTVVEFSDFECPFCGRAAKTVEAVRKKYGNKIQLVFKQFPLPMHKDAFPAAEMSMCVNEEGTSKFWKFNDLAFAAQDKLDPENLVKLAGKAGADEKKVKACFEAHKFAQYVKTDMAYGEKLGVRSTPLFFVNGQVLNGAQPIEAFTEVIDEAMASAQ
jgi:protein-disulfide isomerase